MTINHKSPPSGIEMKICDWNERSMSVTLRPECNDVRVMYQTRLCVQDHMNDCLRNEHTNIVNVNVEEIMSAVRND